jgi:hypothetical protein
MRYPIQNIIEAKNGWGMAEVVEYLRNKHVVLSSNPSTLKKKVFQDSNRGALSHCRTLQV